MKKLINAIIGFAILILLIVAVPVIEADTEYDACIDRCIETLPEGWRDSCFELCDAIFQSPLPMLSVLYFPYVARE